MPWIALGLSAEAPRPASALPAGERQRLRQDLLDCERLRLAAAAAATARPRESPTRETFDPREVRGAWRQFFLAHAAFFHTFALLAAAYEQGAATLERGDLPEPEVAQACSLWRLAGALMAYGVDFAATEAIYRSSIRPCMPEAFSGTWLREFSLLSARRRPFEQALEAKAKSHPEPVLALKARLFAAEKSYHTCHFGAMLACVPDLSSKLQEYQMEHGKLTPEERHAEIFDAWFHVVRLPEVSLSSFVRSATAVFSELLADLRAGTSLPPGTRGQLTDGVATVLALLRQGIAEETPLSGSS
jgi:hypothetical protein